MRPGGLITNLEALSAEADAFIRELLPKKTGATLVTLSGDLGAGKTSFTQAVAGALGIPESVTSPTFVLAKIYVLPEGSAFKKLLHIDAYRLSKGKDLEALGFEKTMMEPGTLVFLEWPEIVQDTLPQPDVAITLVADDEGSRTITYA